MSKTKTAETIHGSVEYETVECDSCGNETVTDDAKEFTIGDRQGKACEHCYKNGPISFPERAREFTKPSGPHDMFFGPAAGAPIILPIIFANVFTGGYDDERKDYMTGVVSGALAVVLWVLPFVFAWWLL